jgi:uncharacterized protein YdaU (DUF1376 family)
LNYYEHHLGDYLRDTAHLSMIEDGAYRRLIDLYYTREDLLPPNLDAICRLIRARSEEEKAAVIVVLDEFFTRTDDGYRHKRCDEEVARYHEKQEKARSSANARWTRSERNANAMRTQCDGTALQTPDSSNQKKKEEGASAPFVSGLDPKAWEAWVGYRKTIGKSLNPKTYPLAQKKMAALGQAQMAAVEHSIANNYRGLFPPSENGKQAPKGDRFANAL